MTGDRQVPSDAYGVLERTMVTSDLDAAAEQIRNLGFAVLDGGYTPSQIAAISQEFDTTHQRYVATQGETRLRKLDELQTIRAPLTHGGDWFIRLALNARLLVLVGQLIPGKFILTQQNGIINPPRERYNQGQWHRDLPYQHFVSTRPLAVNAVFCIDDFSRANGATFILPASHKSESFPSTDYIEHNALQIEAKAGSFIVLDCMMFHSGGFNSTQSRRRAVNQVYNIPYFKQQINIPANMKDQALSHNDREILGFDYIEPLSIDGYFASIKARAKR